MGNFGASTSVHRSEFFKRFAQLKKKTNGRKWSISVWILPDVYEMPPNVKIYPFICL